MTNVVLLLACTLMMEAGGCDEDEIRLVASVIHNRVFDKRWGKTVKDVVLAKKQFTCWNDNHASADELAQQFMSENTTAWRICLLTANSLNDCIRHGGGFFVRVTKATHYHTLDVSPKWADPNKVAMTTAWHVYYEGVL